jgi:iron complex outermembrane receptor protein
LDFKLKWMASAALVAAAIPAGQAWAADVDASAQGVTAVAVSSAATAAVDGVTVTGKRTAQSSIVTVPGGTSVVSAEQLQETRISNLSDALQNVPGVFAQSISGGEATLLSIRGSGLTKGGFTYGEGVQVLYDGLPVTSIYGTPYESFDPNVISRVDIYKGANAFDYGATQLGGVIDFIQHTGQDSDPLFVRLEGGSYGYQREQLSSGQVIGPLDYYVSLTHFQTGGYLDNSAASSGRIFANVGYQITPTLKTRLYFSDSRQYEENISGETLAQALTNPVANNPYTGARVNMGSVLLGSKTDWEVDPNSNLELGLGYKDTPLHNGNLPQRTYWNVSDWYAQLRYQRQDTLFGHESHTTAAVLTDYGVTGSNATVTNDTTQAVLGKVAYGGHNITLLASNDFAVTSKLWLLTGLAWIDQERDNQIQNPLPASVSPSIARTYDNFTPRVGFRYDLEPGIQVYGNYSRLIEAPQTISYTTTANGAYTGFTTSGLKPQVGDSYEVGLRGAFDRLTWDIDYFNEQLRNELETIYTTLPNTDPKNPNGITATTNASPTVKEGVEASATLLLWQADGDRLSLKQSYTWDDFYFRNRNLALGQGIEPRVPTNFYQAELNLNHRSGLYGSVSVESVLSPYPVDYVNKTFAPVYAIWGLAVGYKPPKAKWRVFVQGENLSGAKYISSASQTFQATPASAIYTPGVGRTVTGGLTYAF